jgi:hypothetical protein
MFIKEIWRYPVKSMAGERILNAEMGELGVAGRSHDPGPRWRQTGDITNAPPAAGLEGNAGQ